MSDHESYGDWVNALLGNPLSCGAKGLCFVFFAFPVFIILGVLGLSFFPPGHYPRILLLLPGFLMGGVVLWIAGFFAYKLPGFLAIPVFLGLGGYAYLFLWGIARAIVGL